MKLHVAIVFLYASLKRSSAQQVGNYETEEKPTITLKECTVTGGCTSKQAKLTLDANWRWIHDVNGYENCYTGDSWDSGKCSDPVTCAKNCALEGVTKAKYESTYGVKQVEDGVRLNFVTNHEHGTNVGSRLYVMEDDENYAMFYLKNREFSFEVDVSELYCGMNGAMYFSEMEANGGKGVGDNNAGAKYGTGYCDAQCPHDIKFIDGEANVIDWTPNPNDQDGNMGAGKYGACCAEMDIWEANSMANAYTPHTCSVEKLYRCEGIECGDNAAGQRYDGVCDKDGCDINPYRMGNSDFYGRGEEYTVNTLKPMIVVTQFLTTDGTDSGDLSEIRRFYVQDGKIVHSPPSTILGPGKDTDSITDQFCDDKKDLFSDVKDYQEHGGMKGMGESLDRGHVMIFSLWDDVEVNMLWLDAAFPLNRPESDPGIKRGDCPGGESSTPTYLRQTYPSGGVVFKNAAVGEIGSTYQPAAPTPPTTAPTPTSTPQCGSIGCCSQDFSSCVTWCGTTKEQCLSCGQDVHWICGPQQGCKSRWNDCTNDNDGCCDGLTCVDVNPGYSQCQYVAGPPPTTPTVNPTFSPTLLPTPSGGVPTAQPIPSPTSPPIPSNNNGLLFSTDYTLTSWEAFLEIDSLTYGVETNPPVYALQAEGGAAGNGNVVTESQAYGLLITSIVLASWETHSTSHADWNLAVQYFEGYFNGWKRMCLNSNPSSGCQADGQWCKDVLTGESGICLPGWKHSGDLSQEIGTGAAPDGDEDAIVAMILAIKAFEGKEKPNWYDELRKWTDASCTSFLKYNTVVKDNRRLLKLGSCWGGWGTDGNNPSYHSPGSFKVMRDYHTSFPENDRDYALPNFGGSGSLADHWNQLIDTSYETLSATQCPAQGMVPNWATIDVINGEIRHTGGSFSGSGTPQWEYGSEASRTTWRVTIDAALYPSEMNAAAKPYLDPLLSSLENGYNPNLSLNEKYFESNTLTSCQLPDVGGTITSFSGGWKWNAFIFAPTVSSLVVPIDGITESEQQEMIDKTGAVLASDIPTSYYHRCWTIIGILTINGAVESAGIRLASPGTPTDSPLTPPPVVTPTSGPVAAPTSPPAGCYSKNYKHCLPDGYASEADTCELIWLPNGAQTNCLALWGECNQSSDCCGEAVCFGDNEYATCVPPSDEPDTPVPSKNPTPPPMSLPTPAPVNNCIVCDDVETAWMANNGKDCTTSDLINTKCNKNDAWSSKKFCQLSCYNAGNGYPGDVCCSSVGRTRNLRAF